MTLACISGSRICIRLSLICKSPSLVQGFPNDAPQCRRRRPLVVGRSDTGVGISAQVPS